MDRPSDHAGGLIEFVEECRTSDMDVDRIGKADLQFGHVLRARNDDGVVARRPGIEERHRSEAEQVVSGSSVRRRRFSRSRFGRGGRAVAQKTCCIEGQQHRHRARRDGGKTLPGCAVEARHPIGRRCRLGLVQRVKLHGDRVPVDVGGRNARGLHVLRSRGNDAGGEREARNAESAQHDAPLPCRSGRRDVRIRIKYCRSRESCQIG
jgi:hypothetical protein